MATMRTLLAQIWSERSEPKAPDGSSWCRPLSPSQVQRTIMFGVAHHPATTVDDLDRPRSPEGEPVAAALAPGLEGLPGLNGHVIEKMPADQACAYLRGGGWDVVVRLTGIAQVLAQETAADLPADQHGNVAMWAGGVVGTWFRERRSLPPAVYLADRRCDELQRRAEAEKRNALRLGDDELDATYRQEYDELWDKHGAASLRAGSPVTLGLGRYERPPWRDCGESNWRCGTDRSVLSRYGDYFAAKGWARDPDGCAEHEGLDLAKHIRTRILDMDPPAIVGTELRRACRPLGLHHPEHRVLVTAVAQGLCDADLHAAYELRRTPAGRRPSHSRLTLTGWRSTRHDLPTTEDPDLVGAVTAYAEQWAEHNDVAKRLVNGLARHLPLDPVVREAEIGEPLHRFEPHPTDTAGPPADSASQLDWHIQVQLGPPRRLWGHAHGREVEWEMPFSADEAVRLIRSVFQQSMLDLCNQPIDDTRDSPPAVAADDDRLAVTLKKLSHNDDGSLPELTALLGAGAPAWVSVYLRIITGGAPFGPEHAQTYLSPAEFRAFSINLGFDDDPEGI